MTWPYPGDSAIARARRVALAYRTKLAEVQPQACRTIDALMLRWGQTWAVPRVTAYEPDDMLPPAVAADLANVSTGALRALRQRKRLAGKLIDGVWHYRARDIIALSAAPRRRTRNGGTAWPSSDGGADAGPGSRP